MWSLRTPPPCSQPAAPHQQVVLRPLPYRLERRPVVEALRDQYRTAWPLAVSDPAIDVVDNASFRRHEPVLVLAPAVLQKRGRSRRAHCCGEAERCKQRQGQDHHSHICLLSRSRSGREPSGDCNDHVAKAKPRGPELVSPRKQFANDRLVKRRRRLERHLETVLSEFQYARGQRFTDPLQL